MPVSLSFAVAGTFSLVDDGIAGNGTSVIKDANGTVVYTLVHPVDSVALIAVAGVTLNVNITDSLGSATFTLGSLTDPTESFENINVAALNTAGVVTMAAYGAIQELGSDVAPDIVGGQVILSAGTGVGTSGNAIETQTFFMEAETGTGGIALTNTGVVYIGGLVAEVDGLNVATSGDIRLTATGGAIVLNSLESVASIFTNNGNITLNATGSDSDVTSAVNKDAITATGGSVTINAGRDITFGTGGADFDNDVFGATGVSLTAGRDVTVDGFADMLAGAGDMTVTAGRNIAVLEAQGTDGSFGTSGSGNVTLTTGAGGFVQLRGNSPATVFSNGGNAIINADILSIGATAGITASSGEVLIRTATSGRTIDVGSATDGSYYNLEIGDAELDRIFTQTLTIGEVSSGNLNVTAGVTPGNANRLTLRGQDINIASGAGVTTNELVLEAGNDILLHDLAVVIAPAFRASVDRDGGGGRAYLGGTFAAAALTLEGNAQKDDLTGTLVDDTIDGGAGADRMWGRTGNDLYYVDHANDVVIELASEGTDTVRSGLTYTLGNNVENLILAGAANRNGVGNELNNQITGNSGDNYLRGYAGADTINAGGGADTLDGGELGDSMRGGGGDDLYYVNHGGDIVDEVGSSGVDTVRSSITYTLTEGVENLIITGPADRFGTGNALNNTMTGNEGNNRLRGLDGADTLKGGGGADTLEGGAGADSMAGASGDDTYNVDDAGDIVDDASPTGGNDTVISSITYTLGSNVENLIIAGGASRNGIGNFLNNSVTGNGGDNSLRGMAGDDTINGGSGADTVNGGEGADVLSGGLGADVFLFDAPRIAANTDTVSDFNVADDTIHLDDAIFTGLAPGALAASAFHIGSAAADASDRIIYNSANGALYYDSNGDAAGGVFRIATLSTGLALTTADFLVI